MPQQELNNDDTQEIDISELIGRIEALEEKIHSQAKELEKIKTIGSGYDSRIKECEECIESIADFIGHDADSDHRAG